ncbi:MAG: acyl--CoA ligase, partial [Chloroflexi bacterium]|nr:acyl--CoA ligase [Chloroflexota bacterium]
KGVSLSHRSYLATRLTFEQYFDMSESTQLDLLLVNPMHHANSSALTDLGLRREGAVIHLLERYTTAYWKILVEVARQKRELLVTSLVSRHIDFLESLATQSFGGRTPIEVAEIKDALAKTDILIGSAPVGPTTVGRILKFSGRPPLVRFGATETCLQMMATSRTWPQDELMKAFEAGWSHCHKGEETSGYYIGREHFPFTRVKVVKAIEPGSSDYFRPCEIGEPGYLVTQGPNLMSGYIGDAQATREVFREGWYTGLRDIVFTLKNRKDGQLDYYWLSRDSALLIRGGANYAYDQIAAELSRVLQEDFQLQSDQFSLAVIGLRLESEHEDSCCVTIELNREAADIESQLQVDFIDAAARKVSKGARPDYVRFGRIPLNFKGAVLYPQLKQEFLDWFKSKT